MQFTQKVSLEFPPDESREFLQLMREFKKLLLENKTLQSKAFDIEFVNDLRARCILSGDTTKPISKKTFNGLRAEGKITTYHPSEGRTAYKVSELYSYLESTKVKSLLK